MVLVIDTKRVMGVRTIAPAPELFDDLTFSPRFQASDACQICAGGMDMAGLLCELDSGASRQDPGLPGFGHSHLETGQESCAAQRAVPPTNRVSIHARHVTHIAHRQERKLAVNSQPSHLLVLVHYQLPLLLRCGCSSLLSDRRRSVDCIGVERVGLPISRTRLVSPLSPGIAATSPLPC